MNRFRRAAIDWIRSHDRSPRTADGTRRVLVDARTPVNYVMVAPVVRAMARDERVQFYFTASEEPARIREIYHEAPHVRLVDPRRAALMRFDAYSITKIETLGERSNCFSRSASWMIFWIAVGLRPATSTRPTRGKLIEPSSATRIA